MPSTFDGGGGSAVPQLVGKMALLLFLVPIISGSHAPSKFGWKWVFFVTKVFFGNVRSYHLDLMDAIGVVMPESADPWHLVHSFKVDSMNKFSHGCPLFCVVQLLICNTLGVHIKR